MRALVALVSAVVLLTAASPAGGTGSARATLRLAQQDPLTLRGTSFRRYERVRVTVTIAGSRTTRIVRASRRGAFLAAFAGVRFDPCLFAIAVGSKGSRTAYELSERFCFDP